MVNLEDIPVDAAISGTEQALLNDGGVAKLAAVNSILAKQHNHTASDITNFNTAVDARIDVPTDTAKPTPVDTDVFALWDTIRKKVTRANIKATLKTYFDTLYVSTVFGNWKTLYSNGSGDLTELTFGASGTVFTSNGATSAPTFTFPAFTSNIAILHTTRAMNATTGSVNIAHGLSATPKVVIAIAKYLTYSCEGFSNGTTHRCTRYSFNFTGGSGATESSNVSGYCIEMIDSDGGGSGNDKVKQSATASFDGTNVTLSWTKATAGSVTEPSTEIQITLLAFA